MTGRRFSGRTLGEHAIFGDEEAARLQSQVDQLREFVNDLASQVHAQFTTISAHAEIARQQAEFVREEARSDVERTRALLIDLIERTRRDLSTAPNVHVPGTAPGPSLTAFAERVDALESGIESIGDAVARCFDRQRVLADTIEALFDSVMAERRNEPVAGLSLV